MYDVLLAKNTCKYLQKQCEKVLERCMKFCSQSVIIVHKNALHHTVQGVYCVSVGSVNLCVAVTSSINLTKRRSLASLAGLIATTQYSR